MPQNIFIFIYITLTFLTIDHLFINKHNISALAETKFASHTIINKFAVLIPGDWNAKTQSNTDDFFIFTNYKMEDENGISIRSIKTEVLFIAEPLDIILENQLRAIENSPESIVKQGDISIDGKRAKRIWCRGKGIDFTHTISSFIAYNQNETVVIHSYYHPQNLNAVDTIERVHWSFKNLD